MKYFVCFLIGAVIGTCAVYIVKPDQNKTSIDAMTQATPAHGDEVVPLPYVEGDFEVLGQLPSLKKFVVKYDDKIFRGGEPYNSGAVKALGGLDIKTIISVTADDKERAFADNNNLTLVEIPFDHENGPSKLDISRFIDCVKKTDSPIYVHCKGGSHRAGVLCLAYRLYVQGWEESKALLEYSSLGGSPLDDKNIIEPVLAYKSMM